MYVRENVRRKVGNRFFDILIYLKISPFLRDMAIRIADKCSC